MRPSRARSVSRPIAANARVISSAVRLEPRASTSGEGETMLEAQVRVVAELLRWRDEHAGGCVAVVSHADIIRAALAYALGMPLDLAHRLAVDPASVSEIELHDWGALVRRVNDTCAARPPDMG